MGKKLGRTSLYNRLLCKGLIAMQAKEHEQALSYFVEAHKVSPRNREIIFYKSSAMIMVYMEVAEKVELSVSQIRGYMRTIQGEYITSVRLLKNDHFLYFYRGLLNLYMRNFEAALHDLDRAVRYNEEACFKYHMFRGLTYACMSMFKEAMKDLSAALKLKDDYILAYYNRGKCAYLLGDTDLAFTDFQKILLLKPVSLRFSYTLTS